MTRNTDTEWKPYIDHRSAATWAGISAATAATVAALLSKKNKLRNSLISGAIFGPAAYGIRAGYDILKGNPFNPSQQVLPSGDTVYVGVTGAGDGKGTNLHKAMINAYGADNIAMFRWSDRDKLRKFLRDAQAAGKQIRGFGHSYGAATLLQEIRNTEVPVESVTTADPVSWTDRVLSKPKNIRNWYNYIPPKSSHTFNDFIATIGGKWGSLVPNSITLPNANHGTVVIDY